MKIDTETSQTDLQRLYDMTLRREFLRCTPLNLKVFLRYAVLFLLFPGMLLGFKAGILVTIAFCGILTGILIFGGETVSTIAICVWLALGLLALARVNWGVIRRARDERRRRAAYRPATPGLKHARSAPQKTVLKWHPGERGKLVARLTVSAREKGVCAMLLSFRDYDGRRIMTGGVEGTCIVQSNGQPGQDFHALILYRLEAGNHELSWAMPGDKGPLQAEISQINRL
ncbi:MAG: hypothetical protein E7034_05190 [Akkermansiaceae bacterium]|nr:hypothetical protein [Akkermansiaceae bacterium]